MVTSTDAVCVYLLVCVCVCVCVLYRSIHRLSQLERLDLGSNEFSEMVREHTHTRRYTPNAHTHTAKLVNVGRVGRALHMVCHAKKGYFVRLLLVTESK